MPFDEADEQKEAESVVNVIPTNMQAKLVVTPHEAYTRFLWKWIGKG